MKKKKEESGNKATGTKICTFLKKLTLYKETNKTTITKRIQAKRKKK